MSATLELPATRARRLAHYDHVALASASVLVACIAWMAAHVPVLDNNEGVYARVAMEMARGGSWIVPTLDGVPYLEKPPLLYWITAFSIRVVGLDEAAVRLAPILGWSATLAAVYFFSRRWWNPRVALLGAAVTASSPLVVLLSCALMFDMLFTGCEAWALFALYEALAGDHGRRWLRVSFAALGLAILAKGFVALVFFGAASLVLLADPATRRTRLRILADPLAWVLLASIAVPWHVSASVAQPGFAWFYFINEHVMRFLGLRVPNDYYRGAPWYYLPRFAGTMAPWLLLLLVPARPAPAAERELRRYLAACVLVPLVFFTASQAKANYYMIVAVPPLAMLLARRLASVRSLRTAVALPLLVLAFLAWLALGGHRLALPGELPGAAPLLWAFAFGSSLAAIVFLFRSRVVPAALALAAAVALPLTLLVGAYMEANHDGVSLKRMGTMVALRKPPAVFLYRDFDAISSIAFYLPQPLGVIDSTSNELWYGLRLAPDAARFPTTQAFAASIPAADTLVVALKRRGREIARGPLASHLEAVASVGPATLYRWKP